MRYALFGAGFAAVCIGAGLLVGLIAVLANQYGWGRGK